MKFYTSYFYQVRFMRPNMVPFSTAVWDPKWFHNFQDLSYIFLDKNGILNGLRAEDLSPKVGGCCKGCQLNPDSCNFIVEYKAQLESLDFKKLKQTLEKTAESVLQANDCFDKEPEIVLLVYETPNNHCSERESIQEWFKNNGCEIQEWSKNLN